MVDELILFPSWKISNVKHLMKWHDFILERTLELEFNRKIIKSTLKLISRLKADASNEKEHRNAAKLELKVLTALQKHYKENLEENKKMLSLMYSTNEAIAASLLPKESRSELFKYLEEKYGHITSDALHGGGKGWRFEYETMNYLRKKGFTAFLTFGTLLEPGKVDVVAAKVEGEEKIELNLKGFEKVRWDDVFEEN